MRRSTIIMFMFRYGRVPFAVNFMPPAWVAESLATVERVIGPARPYTIKERIEADGQIPITDLGDVPGLAALTLEGALRAVRKAGA